jgi:dTMP kinase
MKNFFVAFEGIDGSGKSTQVKRLAHRLESLGHRVHVTCEPTTGPIGRMIRDIFTGKMPADQHTIAALFVADRMEHLLNPQDGLLKLLQEGYTVISDRYYFSSYAYHSVHVPMQWVIDCNARAAELLKPDLNVFVDIHPEVSMDRIQRGRSSTELYENLENLTQTRSMYLEAIQLLKHEEKIIQIDGSLTEDEVSKSVWGGLQDAGLV